MIPIPLAYTSQTSLSHAARDISLIGAFPSFPCTEAYGFCRSINISLSLEKPTAWPPVFSKAMADKRKWGDQHINKSIKQINDATWLIGGYIVGFNWILYHLVQGGPWGAGPWPPPVTLWFCFYYFPCSLILIIMIGLFSFAYNSH